MKDVAVWTITWDRLDYTIRTFEGFWEKAGYPFDHYIVDNGSSDGTQSWLRSEFNDREFIKGVILNDDNRGVVGAVNQIRHTLEQYDYVLRLDNDCEIVTDNILQRMMDVMHAEDKLILNPVITGISAPRSGSDKRVVGGEEIGKLGGIGGIFYLSDSEFFRLSEKDEFEVPIHFRYDSYLTGVANNNGYSIWQLEDVAVKHMDTSKGQKENKPEYIRKAVANRDAYLGDNKKD